VRRWLAAVLFRWARWLDPSTGEVVNFRTEAQPFDDGDPDRFARQLAKAFDRTLRRPIGREGWDR
jgi:hypothetical protein